MRKVFSASMRSSYNYIKSLKKIKISKLVVYFLVNEYISILDFIIILYHVSFAIIILNINTIKEQNINVKLILSFSYYSIFNSPTSLNYSSSY